MSSFLQQTKRVALQPLHDSVRKRVEPGYERFHDAVYQYQSSDFKVDAASRKAPSIFAGTSSAISPVGSVRDLVVDEYSLRIYEPCPDSTAAVYGVIVYFHGGRDYSCSFRHCREMNGAHS
jgi:acetyl esterase/lipase